MLAPKIQGLRKRTGYQAPEIGELARDADDALKQLTQVRVLKLDAVYIEPLRLSVDAEPSGILLAGCKALTSAETPFAFGTGIHFTWEGSRKQARIDSIDGLLIGTQYRFTFLIVG